MINSITKQMTYSTLIVLFGPSLFTLIVLSLAQWMNTPSDVSWLILILPYFAPIIGIITISNIENPSVFLTLVFSVLYYFSMVVVTFIVGLAFGCKVLGMLCW